MQFKHSLRHRITLSFGLFGIALSLTIATGVYFALESIEEEVIDDALQAELDYFLNHKERHPDITTHISADTIRYYVTEQQKELIPAAIRRLPLGLHHTSYGGGHYYALIAAVDEATIYLVKDATAFEERESAIHIALVLSVIIATIVALWLGRWLSGRVISPVSALAKQVSKLKPSADNLPVANQYAHDEVGQLAHTFDNYLQQMSQFIQREQDFTADASHELRTPITIINGAAELLLENPSLSARALSQVQRIARAGERMQQMLEVLLLLARELSTEQIDKDERCTVADVAQETLEQHRFMVQGKPLTLRTEIIDDFDLNTSRAVLHILLSNLLRNAINHSEQGEISVRISDHKIEVSDTGVGINSADLPHIFERNYRGSSSQGSGIGLSIVKRICDRQGWKVEITSEVNHGTVVSINF